MSYVYYPHINPNTKTSSNLNQGCAIPLTMMTHKLATHRNSPSPNQNGFFQHPAQLHQPTSHLYTHPHHHIQQPTHLQSLPSSTSYIQMANNNQGVSFSLYPIPHQKINSFVTPNAAALKPLRKRAFSKRSKTGCLTCRERRIKCDECKPKCKNGEKSKRSCKFPSSEQSKKKKQPIKKTRLSSKKAKSIDNMALSAEESKPSSIEWLPSEIRNINISFNDSAIANSSADSIICGDLLSNNQLSYQAPKPQKNSLDQKVILPPINPYVPMPKLPPMTNTHPSVQYQAHQFATLPQYDSSATHNALNNKSASVDKNMYQFENHLPYTMNISNVLASPAVQNSSLVSNNPRLIDYNYRKEQEKSSFSSIASSSSSPLFSTSGSSLSTISTSDPIQLLYPQIKYNTTVANRITPTSLSSGSDFINSTNDNTVNAPSSRFRNASVQTYYQENSPSPVSYWPQYVYPAVNNIHVKKVYPSVPKEKGMSLD